jgi:hypothetical protein
MKKLLVALVCVVVVQAAEVKPPEFLGADYSAGKVCRVNPEGKVTWEISAPNTCDVWQLPNGNVLFAYVKGVKEVDADKKIVWEYKADPKEEVYACQRLANGDTLVGELGACRLIEVAPDGKTIKKEVKLPAKGGQHARFRNARKLDNGNYLFAALSEAVVKELDGQGQVVWSVKTVGNPFCAIRLPNGNTLVGCGDAHRIQEFDKDGKVVWEVGENDPLFVGADGKEERIPLRFVGGLQRLPNGNTVVSNWLGHGFIGKGTHLLELTPDKKVLWRNDDHKAFRTIASACLVGVAGVVR